MGEQEEEKPVPGFMELEKALMEGMLKEGVLVLPADTSWKYDDYGVRTAPPAQEPEPEQKLPRRRIVVEGKDG